jgi:hypothetical protein
MSSKRARSRQSQTHALSGLIDNAARGRCIIVRNKNAIVMVSAEMIPGGEGKKFFMKSKLLQQPPVTAGLSPPPLY